MQLLMNYTVLIHKIKQITPQSLVGKYAQLGVKMQNVLFPKISVLIFG